MKKVKSSLIIRSSFAHHSLIVRSSFALNGLFLYYFYKVNRIASAND
ncbi:hypothetical protein [Capnocytophaga leadbetteri]|nr:hypothetical protein [Capnocytophaga leadbetteri]